MHYKAENLGRYYESFYRTLVHGDYKVKLFLSSINKICQLPLMMELIQARENRVKLGPKTWSGPDHILFYNHTKSAILIQFA